MKWRPLFWLVLIANLISAAVNVWARSYWLIGLNVLGIYWTVTAYRRMLQVQRHRESLTTKGSQRP